MARLPLTLTLQYLHLWRGGKSISNLQPETFPQKIVSLCVRKFPIWSFVNSLSSIGLQMSQNGPEQCWRIACGNIYGIRRRLNTHMSAKHSRRGVNCDLPEHKSHQSALVLSAIDTSSTRFQNSTRTENIWQVHALHWLYFSMSIADKKRSLTSK